MVDRSVTVRLRGNVSHFQREWAQASATAAAFTKQLDTGNDRATMLVQGIMAVAPAGVAMGAALTPVLSGVTTQLGFAAAGAGVMALGFNGVGDALEALREYQANPTEESLAKLNETMKGLGPEAREFVGYLDEITPRLQTLREEAQTALPGFQSGIDDMLTRLPQLRDIIGQVADASGQLAAETGEALSSDDWDEFFDFLETEAAPNILAFGRTVGNVFEGLANTWMALDPLSDGFTAGLLEWSRGFADATENLDENERFQGFLDYVQTNGPKAVEALDAMGGAVVSLVEAAAPVGAVSLPILEALAKTLSVVADSPAGPVLIATAAGLSAVSRGIGLYNAANGSALMTFLNKGKSDGQKAGAAFRAAGAGLGVLALASTDLDDKLGLSNTAMFAMMGLVAGPWGAAIGGGIGLVMDLAAANDDLEAAISRVNREASPENIANLRAELDKTYDSVARLGTEVGQGDWLEALGKADLWELAGDGFSILSGSAGEARTALADARSEADRFRDFGALMTGPMGLTADAFDTATQSVEEFTNATLEAFGLLDKRASLRSARDAVREFNKLLKDAPKELERGTRAYDEVEAALDDIASSSLQAAEHLKGMNRVNFLDRQRDAFIDAAVKLGLTEKAAKNLADRLGLLDKTKAKPEMDADDRRLRQKLRQAQLELAGFDRERAEAELDADNRPAKKKTDDAFEWLYRLNRERAVPEVDVDTGGARAGISAVESWLNSIDDETVYVNVRRRSYVSGGDQEFGADGMTVPGPRYPYGDKTLIFAAPGEELISNRHGEADQFRADRAAGRIPGYAGGGRVRGGLQSDFWHPNLQSGIVGELESFIMSLTGGGKRLETAFIDASTVIRMELKLRQKWLTEQLEANRKRMEAEREALRSLKEMRRGLAGTVAGSFSSDLFGEDATFASIMGTLSSDAGNAQAFAVALSQLQDLGFDGAAFRELAASGNLAAAQQLATLSAADIQALEDRYAQRRIQGQLAGSIAGLDLRDEVRAQTKEARQATREMREAKESLHRVEKRLERMEKHAEDNVKATDGVGEDVAKNLNRIGGDAARDR